ncbi:MAG TPA: hypothetical protein PKE16_05940 [Hyphomicrobium sp.]|nr:hypothetical protein [Hyphomicrobium sp.]
MQRSAYVRFRQDAKRLAALGVIATCGVAAVSAPHVRKILWHSDVKAGLQVLSRAVAGPQEQANDDERVPANRFHTWSPAPCRTPAGLRNAGKANLLLLAQ